MDHVLDDLIEHSLWLDASMTLSQAHDQFKAHGCEFMAVLRLGEFVGLCSRLDLGVVLGSRYGFSLNGSRPVTDFMRSNPAQLPNHADLQDAFETVFSRELENFYDDVVLLSRHGEYLGLIRTHTLIRLQNHYHRESISLLQRQAKEIETQNDQMISDLELCWEMQRTLFPSSYPSISSEVNTLTFSHFYQPHAVVGGDFFHWRKLSDSVVGVLIADVMGHNLRSALITTMMRALFDEHASSDLGPDQVLYQMNQSLVSMLAEESGEVVYVTACYLTIDTRDLQLQWASAGHPMPILLSSSSGQSSGDFLDDRFRGTIMGIFGDAEFTSGAAFLNSGDRVLLYTDGIYEVRNAAGQDFGVESLLSEAIACGSETDNNEFLAALVDKALKFSEGVGFSDDLCLVCVQCNGVS